MKDRIDLSQLLAGIPDDSSRRLGIFALLTLGIIESLANGALSTTDAVRVFFNVENCLYVRKKLRDDVADEVMSHGVQLPDLFEALSEQEAQREFNRELWALRSLCLRLLDLHRVVA